MNISWDLLIGLIITIIGGVTVQVIRKYWLDRERQSPLPFLPGMKAQGSYKYLEGVWYQYHITRNTYLNNGEPCWSSDVWNIKIKDGFRVSGTLNVRTTQEPGKYTFVGEIREGRLLITGNAREAPQDFFTAIFPDLIIIGSHDPMIGTMMAFDYQGDFYVSPMILHHKKDLTPDDLNDLMTKYDRPEHPISYISKEKRVANKMIVDLIQSEKNEV
jgi:hypothetical protein